MAFFFLSFIFQFFAQVFFFSWDYCEMKIKLFAKSKSNDKTAFESGKTGKILHGFGRLEGQVA